MESCLEKTGIEARNEMMGRSDYQRDNAYSELHPDAKASSGNGKGVGGANTHSLPNCDGPINQISYSNFNSVGEAGNDCDQLQRKKSLSRSLYQKNKEYSALSVNTQRNRREGQYVCSYHPKTKRPCLA